jgi:AraC family transcriptional activator of pobA
MGFKEGNSLSYYEGINDYLQTFSHLKTNDPLFFCFKSTPENPVGDIYKPPFKKGFYTVHIATNRKYDEFYFGGNKMRNYNTFLIIQPPGAVYSLQSTINQAKGYTIFFKPEFFSFVKYRMEQEFPFFQYLQRTFFELNEADFNHFAPHFEGIYNCFSNDHESKSKMLALKTLELLYEIRAYVQSQNKNSPSQVHKGDGALLHNFLNLVTRYFIEKRTVKEYALLMSISPNYLSQLIKKHTGKKALSFINEKMANEAKSYLLHSNHSINEIAQQLKFTDTSNFIKFFKSQTSMTPLEFKSQNQKTPNKHNQKTSLNPNSIMV